MSLLRSVLLSCGGETDVANGCMKQSSPFSTCTAESRQQRWMIDGEWLPGPSAEDGLQMQSFRSENGLESYITFPAKYTAFPGIINGGLMGTAFECQGNWTAAVALMDRSSLPKPPMTLTAELLVRHPHPYVANGTAFITPLPSSMMSST